MFDNLAGLPNPMMLTKLAYFVSEREHIKTEREAGAKSPWTEDTILQTYRFCNVRRKDDRVSQWIIKHIIEPHNYDADLWFQLCCARIINWPPTIQALMDAKLWPATSSRFKPADFGNFIDDRVKSGQKTWTGAYIITARHCPPDQGKGYWVASSMLDNLLENYYHIEHYLTMCLEKKVAETIDLFAGAYGFGNFITGQVVADLTYSSFLSDALDLYSYAPIGPGSTRGLNRLFGRKLEGKIHQAQFNDELQFVAKHVNEILRWDPKYLTLHDWQNCMCEFDKYIRVDNGSGRPRSTYKPETAF